MVGKPKNTEGKYVEGTTEVIYEYEKLEELNVPMDPKGSNNPQESLKGESLKKTYVTKHRRERGVIILGDFMYHVRIIIDF